MTSNIKSDQSLEVRVLFISFKRRLLFLSGIVILPIILAIITKNLILSYVVTGTLILVIAYLQKMFKTKSDRIYNLESGYSNFSDIQRLIERFVLANFIRKRSLTKNEISAQYIEIFHDLLLDIEMKNEKFENFIEQSTIEKSREYNIETIIIEIKEIINLIGESVIADENKHLLKKIILLKQLIEKLETELDSKLYQHYRKY